MNDDVLKQLRRDEKLRPVLENYEMTRLKREENIALYLCLSIISQQLSTRVAKLICDRFLELIGSYEPTCERILAIETTSLRSIGLSQSKCNYIHNVCIFFGENQLDDNSLHAMSDEAITDLLIQIKGVGKWTIQMLLMFAMAREDVFSPDDLGIQQAMRDLYGLQETNPKQLKQRMTEVSLAWKPYRTYACLSLWSWKDRSKKGA
jgi:DNA-3-methyladenine glycosylase II